MWTTARVGALVLAVLGLVSVAPVPVAQAQEQSPQAQGEPSVVVTDAHISRLKSALKLTPAQEVHWRTLETALRDIVRRPQEESSGLVQRVRARINGYVLNAAAMRRVAHAAQPLIASLDDQQKQDGMTTVRALGVASLF